MSDYPYTQADRTPEIDAAAKDAGECMEDLNYLLSQLAIQRKTLQDAKDGMAKMVLAVTATKEYQSLEETRTTAAGKISLLDTEIKKAAEDIYWEIKEKNFSKGVKIAEKNSISYEPDKAIEWCEANLPEAVDKKLDVTLFERHAKAVQKTKPVEIVTYMTTPVAQIASDLSDFLPQEPTAIVAEIPF